MKLLEKIQGLPEKERKQLFAIILLGALVVLVGAWVVISQLPTEKNRSKEALFQSIKEKAQEASAGFREMDPNLK